MFKTLFIALVVYWILHFTKSGMTDQVDELKAKYKEYREASKSYIKPAAIAIRLFWLIVFAPFFALVALFEIATALSDAWKQTIAETKAAANAEPEPATVGASNAEATEPETVTVCASNDEEDEMPSSVQDDEPEMEEKPVQKIYRHYGSDSFSRSCLQESQENGFGEGVKPYYGCFWASPLELDSDGEWTTNWRDWCTYEDFARDKLKTFFDFHISEDARILEIHNANQWREVIRAFPSRKPMALGIGRVDWDEVAKHFDGVEMFYQEYLDNLPSYHVNKKVNLEGKYLVEGWDVDSIAIWNPDVIVVE